MWEFSRFYNVLLYSTLNNLFLPMFRLKKILVRLMLLLLVSQQAVATGGYTGMTSEHESQYPEVATEHCESMATEHSGLHDASLQDHQECVDADCTDCLASAVCLPQPVAAGLEAPVVHQLNPDLSIKALPEPDLLYRPPIAS